MRWTVLILLFLGMIVNFADKSIIGLAAKPIMEDLGLGPAQWGIVGSAYYWLYPITGVIGAAYADRLGAKKMLSFLMLTWAVLQFGVIAITALPLLIVYRILLGAFEGPFSPVAYAHADRWFPPKLKGFANSVLVSGATVGSMVVAPLLVAMIAGLGWKIAFAALGVVSIVWFFLFMLLTKESPVEAYEKAKKKKKLEKFSLKDLKYIASSKTALFTTLAYFSTYFIVVWIATWMPLYLIDIVGMTAGQMGFAVAAIGIISVVLYMGVSVISDYAFKKTKNWKLSRIYITGASMLIGAICMLSVIVYQNPIWVVIAMCLSKGLTYAILPIGPTIMINEMPERGGLMTSILTSSGNLAGIVAPLATGFVVSLASTQILGYSLSIGAMASLVLIFSILFMLFARPNSTEQKEKMEEEAS
ncbi:MFS transporter, ACS family, aldohexuronate transporter [Cytobacillus horneckiae]|uniref:MFS transporter n=1 Tax=Cytobacillus horneckiae TaxID=549687 RepID=A0A2N0ZLG8_9BACI|nr:MFS transporter [Cytobacillus horneckiae]NRG45704.1 MFS transporter [Bacillus sp. CRN 9]MBN6885759.1 MFS transporter [Cytobacillus horneckiae]MCM3177305.1 MFS transporter [Cytobacillus horneckiae]MEC1156133.1 MFS transporter [Cytobacillus horneckiae]MED2937492.1 MFS transporter [Cytobacillus horneckiae]